MNRAEFFTSLRRRNSGVFGSSLSKDQVRGTEALIDEMIGWPVSHTSHVLAEVYHETGGGMMPVKETVYRSSKDRNPSDAKVIARLDRAWARGQLSWVKAPYWRDGWFGRGQIQITHRTNYQKAAALTGVDLVSNPGRALELPVSAQIAAQGCKVGMFRGKRLSHYDGDTFDHYRARNIVNGDTGLNGKKIAKYARAFEAALQSAGWREGRTPPPPDVEPVIRPQTPQKRRKGSVKGVGALAGLIAAVGAGVAALKCKLPFIEYLISSCGG